MNKSSLWKLRLPAGVFFFVLLLLVPVQLKVERPMLLLERFVPGGGWFELLLIACYGGLVAWKMQDPARVQRWRRHTWLIFSLEIDRGSCTECMACTPICHYDALNEKDIRARRPALTCTLCGDCVTSCSSSSIRYRFLKLPPAAARDLYLLISIGLHASTLALARI